MREGTVIYGVSGCRVPARLLSKVEPPWGPLGGGRLGGGMVLATPLGGSGFGGGHCSRRLQGSKMAIFKVNLATGTQRRPVNRSLVPTVGRCLLLSVPKEVLDNDHHRHRDRDREEASKDHDKKDQGLPFPSSYIHICCIPVELCQIIAFLFAFFLHHLCGGVGMDRAMKDEGRRLSLSFIAFFPSPTESATSHRRSRSR